MGKDDGDNTPPFVYPIMLIGTMIIGFIYMLESWADVDAQILRDRAQNPNAWRGLDRIYLPLLWEKVESERWRKRMDDWFGRTDKAQGQEREGPKGWMEEWDVEKMMESSLISAMDGYERMLEEGTAGHGWSVSRTIMDEKMLQERLRGSGIVPRNTVEGYERKLKGEGLSLDGKKFWPESIERSVLEKTGKRRTAVFTVTARDKKGCSLGFTVEVLATFEYWEMRGGRRGFFVRALGRPDSYGWKLVDEWGASRKKEVPRKITCPNIGGTSSLLREKRFPHKRIKPAPAMRAQRGAHGKMRRVC